MSDVDLLFDAVLELDEERILTMLRDAPGGVLSGIDSLLVPALEKMGALWDQGDVSLSQLYLAGKVCEEVAGRLFERNEPGAAKGNPRIALAVLEDYHLLGKRIVLSVLRASGCAVRDYGRRTVEELVRAVADDGIELLFVSTLMLPSALRVKDLCSRLKEAGLTVKTIVGGAPFRLDPALWKEVGADGMGASASDALGFVRKGVPR